MQRNKKFVRITCIVLVAIMVLGLFAGIAPLVFAADIPTFSDVTGKTTYGEDIRWAASRGIALGYNNKFNPTGKVTLVQYLMLLSRAIPFSSNEQQIYGNKSLGDVSWERADKLGWVPYNIGLLESVKNDGVCVDFAYDVAFRATGTVVYSAAIKDYGENLSIGAALGTANELGLTDATFGGEQITRAEAVHIIRQAVSETYTTEQPLIVKEFEGTILTCPTSDTLDSTYAELSKIPQNIRTAFIENGWKISFDMSAISDFSNSTGIYSVKGLTDTGTKRIYIANPDSIVHEVGHAYQYMIYLRDFYSNKNSTINESFDELFAQEGSAGKKLTGQYSSETGYEHFANCFAYYINALYKSSQHDLDLMGNTVPQTKAYFDSLAENGWEIE